MDLLSKYFDKFSKGQIYQALVTSTFFLIYVLGLTIGVLTDQITIAWIMDRFIGLTFIGLLLLIIFPVWRQQDTVIGKVMRQMGICSFTLLILTWFIYLVQLFGVMQPTGHIEKVIFDLCKRFAYYTFFPLAIVIMYGKVQWDEMLNLGDPEAD